MRLRLAVFAAALAAPAAVFAHDFWIEPSSFHPAVGSAVQLRLFVGPDFQGEPFPRVPNLISRFVVATAAYAFTAGNTVPDTWDVSFGESASYMRFLSALDRKATLYRPWSGMITVDTQLHDGVPVLRLVTNSPAAKAGVQAAEVVQAVEGKPVKVTTDLLAAVEQGIDTLIVGEGPHHTAVRAPDMGLAVIYAGHYATETPGVRALADHVGQRFVVPWSFVSSPTGL